jgi:hypothetical protein
MGTQWEEQARNTLKDVLADARECQRLTKFERQFLFETCQGMYDRGYSPLDFSDKQEKVFKQIEQKLYST